MPLIHLGDGDQNYEFFPQELLEGSPYRIRVIEHDDFIDYEIEFLDMDMEGDEYMYEYYTMDEDKEDGGTSTGFGIAFMDLLERAKKQHQGEVVIPELPELPKVPEVTVAATEAPEEVTEVDAGVTARALARVRQGVSRAAGRHRGRSSTSPKPEQGGSRPRTKTYHPTTQHTTTSASTEKTTMETTTRHRETTESKPETTTEISETNEETTERVEASTTSMMYPDLAEQPRSAPLTPEAAAGSITAEPEITETTTLEDNEGSMMSTVTPASDPTTTETTSFTTTEWMLAVDVEEEEGVTESSMYPPRVPERRPKKIASSGVADQSIASESEVILSGQYHEVNPGQYKEVNPGQYHEQNPGQYHEVNPGQYHEKHPGQVDVESVKVDFQHSQDTRVYNVQASAGEFILGEVGRIDNYGQTLQGVRYTAVEGEVDEARIADILNRYFGARM